MSHSSNSPAPKSNESAEHSPSNADFLYEQSAVSSESNASAGSSPPSPPPSPPASSPSSQPPPPPNSQSPPPSSPPPPPQSSPPPKPSRPPPPKSSPSPPPSSPPPSPPLSSPPPSPPPSKSPPAPPRSPTPKSSSSPPSPPSPSSSSPSSSPSGASPPKATPTSPPSENESAAKPPAPSSGEASQSNPAPETPVSPPAAPGTPGPPTPNPNPNPNPATPAVPTTPKTPKEATNSTPKTPVASGPPPNLSSVATNTTAAADDSSSSGHTGTVIGLTVAGVFFLALIAVVFLFVRRRKKKSQPYPPNYMPPPPGAANKSEGYYPGQGPNSGPAESYYSNGPFPQSSFENSYGSQRERNGAISGGGSDSGLITGTKVHFSYEELMDITNGFSRQNVLGEGGFGCVYKGWMLDGKVVAVKQLKAGSGQGEKEFRAEVEIITRVHHRHLVSLVGYCISEQQRLLIYEFVPNQTLEHHLHGPGMPVLEWTKRLKIALGSAKGLAYLHEDCHPKIIHRDIKSANILLDDSFEAQVADFGLAKLTNDMNTHVSTRVMGTFGYMAPEYASSGKLTDRSDVFSFGVVLLELITGRKPVDPTQPLGDESLVEWARPLLIKALESGDLSELIDPRLEKHYVEGEMLRMVQAAAACVRHSATKRPRMAQVCRSLDCEDELSDLSNGVKFGQSTAYDSGQYNEDIVRFRRMALGSGGSSEFEISSSEFNPASRELSGPQSSWTTARPDVSSDESETRAFNNQGSASKNQRNNSVRRF